MYYVTMRFMVSWLLTMIMLRSLLVTPWEVLVAYIQIPDKKTVVSNWEISGEIIPLAINTPSIKKVLTRIIYCVSLKTIIDYCFVCISGIGDHDQAYLFD